MTKTIAVLTTISALTIAGLSAHSAQAKSSWSKAPTVQTASVKWATAPVLRSSWG